MSILDTAFIFFLALIFFGPKKLPELARQMGKLIAEFRRASNDFKFQMEEELRLAEQADSQKKIAAIESQPSALSGIIASSGEVSIMPPATGLPVGAATDPAATDDFTFTPSDSGTAEQQPGDMSAKLGPPSQADAVALEIPATEADRPSVPDPAVNERPARKTSEQAPDPAEEIQEVQSANG